MVLNVYKDFQLQGVIKSFNLLTWRRRYNRPGDFQLNLEFSREMFDLIKSGDVICLQNDQEGAWIENITKITKSNGERVLEIAGRFLSSIMNRRIVNYTATAAAKTHIDAILAQNFLSPTDTARKIPQLVVRPYTLAKNPSSAVEFTQKIAEDCINETIKPAGAGYKVLYNIANKTYDLVFYEGRERDALFSDRNKNIITQDYYALTADMKNVCYVKSNDYAETVGTAQGLGRREMALTAITKTAASLYGQGAAALQKQKEVYSFDTEINSESPQFLYRRDWDLGDIVASEDNDLGILLRSNVVEVTESYDNGGVTIAPVFGDTIPQL